MIKVGSSGCQSSIHLENLLSVENWILLVLVGPIQACQKLNQSMS